MSKPAIVFLLFALLTACSGGPRPLEAAAPPRDARPRLGGLLVLDVPPPEGAVQRSWAKAEALLALEPPTPPEGLDLDQYVSWTQAEWQPWFGARIEEVNALAEALGALEEGSPAERLYAAVVSAHLYARIAALIEALPLPEEVQANDALRAAFEETLRASASPAYLRARASFEQCTERAPSAPDVLRFWTNVCARRLRQLPEIAPPPAPAVVIVPEECDASRVLTRSSEVVPTGRRPVALLHDARSPLGEEELDRLHEAVARYLQRNHRQLRLVGLREIQRARSLAAQNQLPNGSQCARGPRLEDSLRARQASVVFGKLSASCSEDGGCALRVDLGHQEDGRRWVLEAPVSAAPVGLGAFIAAVPNLAPAPQAGGIVALLEHAPSEHGVGFHALEVYGNWGESAPLPTLEGARAALAHCRDAAGAVIESQRVVLEMTPDGSVSGVMLSSTPLPDAARRCLSQTFEDLAFPPGAGLRRLSMLLELLPEMPTPLDYRAILPEDTSTALRPHAALDDPLLRDAVVRCYAQVPDAATRMVSYRVALSVGPDGTVTDGTLAAMSPPTSHANAVAACVEQAVREARFSCSPDGDELTIEATICVGGR